MTEMTNSGRGFLKMSCYTLASISLGMLWLFTSATCEEPYTFNSMDYPKIVHVGAGGIDTIVTGKVPLLNMSMIAKTKGSWEDFAGQKDSEGLGEEVEQEWIHVKTTYATKEVHIKVSPKIGRAHV